LTIVIGQSEALDKCQKLSNQVWLNFTRSVAIEGS